jgi:hypothetical protein
MLNYFFTKNFAEVDMSHLSFHGVFVDDNQDMTRLKWENPFE